ncbi:uncharacterized protein LOC135464927 [Liolophura sinensis]|uniref:uncharacterized protein LOC135464927 n=1 Tax=Liolophura sinensis TaxID=3198878 RepID=UPI0031598DC5
MATRESPTLQHLNKGSCEKGTSTMSAETCQTTMLSLKSKGKADKGEEMPTVSSAQAGCLTFRLIVGDKGVVPTVYSNGRLPKDKFRRRKNESRREAKQWARNSPCSAAASVCQQNENVSFSSDDNNDISTYTAIRRRCYEMSCCHGTLILNFNCN